MCVCVFVCLSICSVATFDRNHVIVFMPLTRTEGEEISPERERKRRKKTDRQTDRQTGRQTETGTDRYRDRNRETETGTGS